ncbi:cryptochrome/photolyase family protein, partial [Candidatus Pelagibacter sp.]|nr:cryptochrome/photolyase family protein [Candidatus Pelagibacter sp.]
MNLFFILGNQLFPLKYVHRFKKDHLFYMAEDYELCTYEKHHKQKILLYLSSMRSYADSLKSNNYKIKYFKIQDKYFKSSYFYKLKNVLDKKNINEVSSFEVEDKFFEKKLKNFFLKLKINWNIIETPMFLNSRGDFKKYLSKSKKPFMATFYKEVRKKSGVLMGSDGMPIGGKWSFDSENRNKLPKDISIPKFLKIITTKHTNDLKPIIEKVFSKHPGNTNNFWFATKYDDVIKLLNFFIKEKANLFGDY